MPAARLPVGVLPIASMVVIAEPPTLSIVVTHDRVATPSMCTVQAPHSAAPQPNFVPVMPSTSRNTQRRRVVVNIDAMRLTVDVDGEGHGILRSLSIHCSRLLLRTAGQLPTPLAWAAPWLQQVLSPARDQRRYGRVSLAPRAVVIWPCRPSSAAI